MYHSLHCQSVAHFKNYSVNTGYLIREINVLDKQPSAHSDSTIVIITVKPLAHPAYT